MTQVIDLSMLAAPDVIENLDFEIIYQELLSQFSIAMPGWTAELESDPVVKLLELAAYREVHLRARINDAAKAIMLAYATGYDLDQLGANYDVSRLDGEDDARFRVRIQQGYHLLAAAGPINAYRQHALAASADIIDVDVWSESPGQVTLSVLARELRPVSEVTASQVSTGLVLFGPAEQKMAYVMAETDSPSLLRVLRAVNAEDVRPLTDSVIVRAPVVREFTVQAVLEVLPGPDVDLVLTQRKQSLLSFAQSMGRIGYDITRAGIIAALMGPSVKNVRLVSPLADIECQRGEIAVMMDTQVEVEVVHV